MKFFFYYVLLMSVGFSLVSCSSDEDKVEVIYHVMDNNGHETSVFNYGDDIVFEVIFTNTTNQTLKFEDEFYFLRGAFIVYDSEGQLFNPIPTDDLLMHPITIEQGEQFCRQLIWPWARVPLPIGKYYSTCTPNIDKKSNKTYTVNFEIIK